MPCWDLPKLPERCNSIGRRKRVLICRIYNVISRHKYLILLGWYRSDPEDSLPSSSTWVYAWWEALFQLSEWHYKCWLYQWIPWTDKYRVSSVPRESKQRAPIKEADPHFTCFQGYSQAALPGPHSFQKVKW